MEGLEHGREDAGHQDREQKIADHAQKYDRDDEYERQDNQCVDSLSFHAVVSFIE